MIKKVSYKNLKKRLKRYKKTKISIRPKDIFLGALTHLKSRSNKTKSKPKQKNLKFMIVSVPIRITTSNNKAKILALTPIHSTCTNKEQSRINIRLTFQLDKTFKQLD